MERCRCGQARAYFDKYSGNSQSMKTRLIMRSPTSSCFISPMLLAEANLKVGTERSRSFPKHAISIVALHGSWRMPRCWVGVRGLLLAPFRVRNHGSKDLLLKTRRAAFVLGRSMSSVSMYTLLAAVITNPGTAIAANLLSCGKTTDCMTKIEVATGFAAAGPQSFPVKFRVEAKRVDGRVQAIFCLSNDKMAFDAQGQVNEHLDAGIMTISGARTQNDIAAQDVMGDVGEHVFNCSGVVGKVFDDRNANGYEDDGEPGLAGVRIVTVKGVIIETDRNGRFHVPCALIPDADIGSNLILKLDERTLPSGFRKTTENPRVVRVNRGKVASLNFGAVMTRIVTIELGDGDYLPVSMIISDIKKKEIINKIRDIKSSNANITIIYTVPLNSLLLHKLRINETLNYINKLAHNLQNVNNIKIHVIVRHIRK